MPSFFEVVDGGKVARFDGRILEVAGMNGLMDSHRIPRQNIEKIGVVLAGEEWMFAVKTKKGGFGAAISSEKKEAWEEFARQVEVARLDGEQQGAVLG